MKYKILEIEQGLILLDEDSQLLGGQWVYDKEQKTVRYVNSNNNHTDFDIVVIASSYIKELPKISQSVEEIRQMVEDKRINDLAYEFANLQSSTYKTNLAHAYFNGYKANKNKYTEEQMKQAILLSQEKELVSIGKQELKPVRSVEQILQSLQPKIDCFVEVTQVQDVRGVNWKKQSNDDVPVINQVYKITKIL